MTETQTLLNVLADRRQFLLFAARGLTDEQARLTPTASALSIGGLIKHVTLTEQGWVQFILNGPSALQRPADGDWSAWENQFALLPEETLADVVAEYRETAAETERVVRDLPSLDLAQPLPVAPWFPANTDRSAREVVVHLIGETAQHAGHADIIRETIDGQKTMG